jgi:hypothetical protein
MEKTEIYGRKGWFVAMSQRGARTDPVEGLFEGYFTKEFYNGVMHVVNRANMCRRFLAAVNEEEEPGLAVLVASKELAETTLLFRNSLHGALTTQDPLPIVYAVDFLANPALADSSLVCFFLSGKITDTKNFTFEVNGDYNFTPLDGTQKVL